MKILLPLSLGCDGRVRLHSFRELCLVTLFSQNILHRTFLSVKFLIGITINNGRAVLHLYFAKKIVHFVAVLFRGD